MFAIQYCLSKSTQRTEGSEKGSSRKIEGTKLFSSSYSSIKIRSFELKIVKVLISYECKKKAMENVKLLSVLKLLRGRLQIQ